MNNFRYVSNIVTRAVLYYQALLKPDDVTFSMMEEKSKGNQASLDLRLVVNNNKRKPFHASDVEWEVRDEDLLGIRAINGRLPGEIRSFEIPSKNSGEFKIEIGVKDDLRTSDGTGAAEPAKPHVLKVKYSYSGLGKKKIDKVKQFDISGSVMKQREKR